MKAGCVAFFTVMWCFAAMAGDDLGISGTWVRWNPRDILGRGNKDTELRISERSGKYFASFTTGHVGDIRDGERRRIRKSTTVSYHHIPVAVENDLIVFSLPDPERTLRLKVTNVDGKRALIEEEPEEAEQPDGLENDKEPQGPDEDEVPEAEVDHDLVPDLMVMPDPWGVRPFFFKDD